MESIYKIDTGSDHAAKFRGDRPRELGDYALKKKRKHHEHFISPPVTPYGRPNKIGIGSRLMLFAVSIGLIRLLYIYSNNFWRKTYTTVYA